MATNEKESKFRSKFCALEKAINECKTKISILKSVFSDDENAKLNGLQYELRDLEKRFDELNQFNEFKHDKEISESFYVLDSNYKKIKKQADNIEKLNQELNNFKNL
jgi:hypothetical protein